MQKNNHISIRYMIIHRHPEP